MATPVPAPQNFTRRLKPDDPMLIESRCDFCGLVITGGVMHGLVENELAHGKNCPGKQQPSDWPARRALQS